MAELADLIADCVASARAQGWEGDDGEYDLLPMDCEGIIEALGRRPTRAEWAAEGYPCVGLAHCADCADEEVARG